jgi:hypothetical protein
MVETGQFDTSERCGGRSGRGYIGRADRRVIEYHSLSLKTLFRPGTSALRVVCLWLLVVPLRWPR